MRRASIGVAGTMLPLALVAAPARGQAPLARWQAAGRSAHATARIDLEGRPSSVRTRYTVIGVAAGAALGAAVILVQCHARCGESGNARAFLRLFALTGAGVGGVIGFLAGSAVDVGRREQAASRRRSVP